MQNLDFSGTAMLVSLATEVEPQGISTRFLRRNKVVETYLDHFQFSFRYFARFSVAAITIGAKDPVLQSCPNDMSFEER